jgi:hypothetical protein
MNRQGMRRRLSLFFIVLCLTLVGLLNEAPEDAKAQVGSRGYAVAGFTLARSQISGVYYDNTIKNIILADCARCHSGVSRNLMDYDSLKAYADSGLLSTMVQGPMRRFAANDADTILAWIANGAPEQAAAARANFGSAAPPSSLALAKANQIYYENTIKNIIQADCGRCHSGVSRNLMDYDTLKAYADSGLLGTMVQGPMRRFAANDADAILTWIANGAPEKSSLTTAKFGGGPAPCTPGGQPLQTPDGRITYSNTIKTLLAHDCLRCHSGQFRNLTTYENVKIYVDNGLLKTLVQRGGPMHRFSGPDSRYIIAWVDSGAPQ